MVQTTSLPRENSGSINVDAWLETINANKSLEQNKLIKQACLLSQLSDRELRNAIGMSCWQQGIEMADLLDKLDLDHEALAAALIYNNVQYNVLELEDIRDHLGCNVEKLVAGVYKMDSMRALQGDTTAINNHQQIDNLRKMLLAMVDDARVVLIKLTERAVIMRHLDEVPVATQQHIAKETMDIYAPLANRLGVSEIKWELEDLAFRYLHTETYKKIAKQLSTTRLQRQTYVDDIIQTLHTLLDNENISNYEVTGRAKHIFSIHKKMQRKQVDFNEIYDAIAVRILVPRIEDCYKALSTIHGTWEHIPQEFDDYVAKPKPNGYRSIHTAVVGPEGHNIEVQIRTYQMHQESELGVAAHWRYKEGSGATAAGKAAWLRQLLEWQRELASNQEILSELEIQAFEDRIYVFTPTGDIVDLPPDSTPLDFAYHIHSEVGHRCRGAKINGKMVQLTYKLCTGDRVEIVRARDAHPSRDWLNPELGYLKTARARSKVHHWLRLQDYEENLILGKEMYERELKRLNLPHVNLKAAVKRYNLKKEDDLFASLGGGDLRLGQITNYVQQQTKPKEDTTRIPNIPTSAPKTQHKSDGITIHGVSDLMTQIAKCCKPIPGDRIIGFVTRGRGITIHRQDCNNMIHLPAEKQAYLTEVDWGEESSSAYPIDIYIKAYDRFNLIHDITMILANHKINMLALNTTTNKREQAAYTKLTIELHDLDLLDKVIDKIQQLPDVMDVSRYQPGKH